MTLRSRAGRAAAIAALVGAAGFAACRLRANLGADIFCAEDRDCGDNSGFPRCDRVRRVCIATDGSVGCLGSAECPAASPICDPGAHACRPCRAGEDDACRARDPGSPFCLAAACVACRGDAPALSAECAAATAPICEHHACRACLRHAECPSLVCRRDGACASESEVVYVDNGGAACGGAMQLGTRANPWCELKDALAKLGMKTLVSVKGTSSAYAAVAIDANITVTIVGPGRGATPTARITDKTALGVAAFSLDASNQHTADVTLDGLDLIGSNFNFANAVECSALSGATAMLTVVNSAMRLSGGAGVSADKCRLRLDGNSISANAQGGLVVKGGRYDISNNFFVDNVAATAVVLEPGSSGTFRFNTVAQNITAGNYGGIDCGNLDDRRIESSIVWGNTLILGTQFVGRCVLDHVVVGAADSASGGIALDPAFRDLGRKDYHLAMDNRANGDCCVDKILPGDGGPADLPDHDVDFTVRPKGGGWDIGAHEVQ